MIRSASDPMWRDDEELFDLMRQRLFSAVIGDVLDSLGMVRQFLPLAIHPLRDDMIVAGRAMPVVGVDLAPFQAGGDPADPAKPFGRMLEALDDLKPGEVYLATGGTPHYALWGELMSTRAVRLGATGAVLDGCSRDTRCIMQMNFPTFSRGRYAQDQKGRGHVVDFRVPVEIGGVHVSPGDLLFGDLDGVVIIPRAAEPDVLRLALEKVEKEDLVRVAIERDGMSAVDALATFGVL